MSKLYFRGATAGALIAALVLGAGAAARASQEDEANDGKVVKIGRADEDRGTPNVPQPQQPQMPKYWIGLLGGQITPDNPLRAHLDLPENQGLIVVNIVPESPAAKAGLKQHDILLRANDKDLHEMSDLVDLVLSEGPKKGQITLEVMRHNKRETVYLTPEERPANAQMPQPMPGAFGENFGGNNGEFGMPQEFLQQFGGQMPMQFRNFGPGVIVGGEQGAASVPNGVSVSINKQDGQPPRVTVKRGEESWEVVGDDPESLKKLPEDLRPFVEQMLHGNGGGMKMHMPKFEGRVGAPGFDNGFQDRLERMEQQMQALQKQLEGNHAPAGDDHKDSK
jgi:hypothetical protein